MRDEEYILWQPEGLSGLNPTENNTIWALNPLGILFVPWPLPCSLPCV